MDIDCPIIHLICVSQYTLQVGHEAEMFIFFPHVEPQENEKRWQQDNMHDQKEQQEITFVSVLLDSIWIVFVTEIMWLIYIVPILCGAQSTLWALSLILKVCCELGIWQLLSSLYGLQFQGTYLCRYLQSVQKTTNGVNWEGLFYFICKRFIIIIVQWH